MENIIEALRSTKIIATIGPATEDETTIRALIHAGVDVFRFNMSHSDHAWVEKVFQRIKAATIDINGSDLGVATLMDLAGPSIRTGEIEQTHELHPGDRVEILFGDSKPTENIHTTVNYPDLHNDVSVDDTILIDNGVLHLRVEKVSAERIICVTITEGKLGSRRRINLPGIHINLPSLTEKDKRDLDLAMRLDFDFIALSFVRDAPHVHELREIIREKKSNAQIIAKIEDREAVARINDIVQASDIIMVARGDLGIEVNIEELPVIQRETVAACLRYGRRVIVATNMLESMIHNPIPTRAEVTDVANAIFEQADAIMLSGETGIGSYPVRCVEVMDRIAKRMEKTNTINHSDSFVLSSDKLKSVKSAVLLADSIENSKLLVFTRRGVMAGHVASLRPKHSTIFAFTTSHSVARRLQLNFATQALLCEFCERPEESIQAAINILLDKNFVQPGDPIIILSDILIGRYTIDSIMLRHV